MGAHLGRPTQDRRPRLVAAVARFVRELEGHDRRVLVVAKSGVRVPPADHVLGVGLVAVANRTRGVELVVIDGVAVLVVRQAEKPGDVLCHATVVRPVVDQREHEPDAELAGFEHGVVEAVECRLVVLVRVRLQREVVAGAVGEGPRPHHRQRHRGGVVEGGVDHVVGPLVQVVGVGAAEAEDLVAQDELAAPGTHEGSRTLPCCGRRRGGGGLSQRKGGDGGGSGDTDGAAQKPATSGAGGGNLFAHVRVSSRRVGEAVRVDVT